MRPPRPLPAPRRPRVAALVALAALLPLLAACRGDQPPTAPAGAAPRPLLVSSPNVFTQVDAGPGFACALRGDGVVECWGHFDPPNQASDTRVAASGTFTQVSAGGGHACAVRGDGVVECWGDNSLGQAPTTRATSGGFTQVSAGRSHTCAVRSDGAVECWGLNDFGEAPATRAAASGTFTQVSAGVKRTCAVRSDGAVECWGLNPDLPDRVAATRTFTQVSVGQLHHCALRSDGVVQCWGADFGEAPDFQTSPSGAYTQVSVGAVHTTALRSDGVVEWWGEDAGKMYNNSSVPPRPHTAATGTFTQVSSDEFHACALRDDGAVECWGDAFGFGTGSVTRAPSPTISHVLPTATFSAAPAAVYPGESFTLALADAQVPDHPAATAFTYQFDCGDGAGYGAASSAASASCPTSAAGTRSVQGRVIDQDGDAGEYAAAVTILTPSQGIAQLRAAVMAAGLAPDLRKALTAKLDAALGALAEGRTRAACSALADFLSQVRAQRGKAISTATADAWLTEATRLRTAIGC
jgi:hypothetical protein